MSALESSVNSEPQPHEDSPAHRARSVDRTKLRFEAFIIRADEPRLEVVIHDFSRNGFQMSCEHALGSRSLIWVCLPVVGNIAAAVRWYTGDRYGCEFVKGITSRQYLEIVRNPSFNNHDKQRSVWLIRLVRFLKHKLSR